MRLDLRITVRWATEWAHQNSRDMGHSLQQIFAA